MLNSDSLKHNRDIDFSIEQRQAPIGLVLFFFETVRKLIKGVWPLIFIFYFKDHDDGRNQLYFYLTIAASAFIIINSLFSYWFFKYQIIDHVLVVKKGYLKKIRLSIPLDRIQTINTKQNIVQRALGLLSLEVDTAGAKDTEIEFIAIRKETAMALESIFNRYKHEHVSDDNEADPQRLVEGPRSKEDLILRLGFKDLCKVGISENHIKSFFIAFGLVYGFYYQVRDVFEEELTQLTEESVQMAEQWSLNMFIGIAVFVFLSSIIVSFLRIVFRFYDLKLSRVKKALKVQFGLLNTKEVHIPISKIQLIAFYNNPLRQWLKFRTLKIKQAVSGERIKKTQAIQIPACNAEDAQKIQDLVIEPTLIGFGKKTKSHSFYFIRTFVVISLFTSFGFYFLRDQGLWIYGVFGVLELFWVFLIFLSYRKRYIQVSDVSMIISRGAIAQTHYYLSLYKIQSVQFNQTIFAKRRGVASLKLFTASGDHLSVPYISEHLAFELYNYILYKVESTHKAWM